MKVGQRTSAREVKAPSFVAVLRPTRDEQRIGSRERTAPVELAALVAKALLARCECAEVLGLLRRVNGRVRGMVRKGDGEGKEGRGAPSLG